MTAAPVRPGIGHRCVTAGHPGQEIIRPCEWIMSPSRHLHGRAHKWSGTGVPRLGSVSNKSFNKVRKKTMVWIKSSAIR